MVLIRLGLLFAALVIAVVLMEVMARVAHLGTGGFWEPHPLYGWRNIPNASGWESCYGECEVLVRINSAGLRDREVPYEKPNGITRIIVLGDSLTAGMQVPLESTFTRVSEQELNEEHSDLSWEVINAGVNGYGTDNELLFYRLEATKYEPDIVVLAMYLANDVYNNHRELEVRLGGTDHKPYFTLDEAGNLNMHNYPVSGIDSAGVQISTFLKAHFQLPRAIAQIMDLRRNVPAALRPLAELAGGRRPVADSQNQGEGDGGGPRADICSKRYAPVIEEAWDITRALLRQLDDEVRANGAQLMVMALPASPQVIPPAAGQEWYCDRPNEELRLFLAEEGIPYLDLLPVFRGYPVDGSEPLYFARDFHMTEAGHLLAGTELADFIAAEMFASSETACSENC